MENDKPADQAAADEFKQLISNPEHKMYEAFKRSDPGALQYADALTKRAWGEGEYEFGQLPDKIFEEAMRELGVKPLGQETVAGEIPPGEPTEHTPEQQAANQAALVELRDGDEFNEGWGDNLESNLKFAASIGHEFHIHPDPIVRQDTRDVMNILKQDYGEVAAARLLYKLGVKRRERNGVQK